MGYFQEVVVALESIQIDVVKEINRRLQKCSQNDGIIYIAGNGGSATIADHFACDYNKTELNALPNQTYRAISLSHSMSLTSALNNDFETKEVFAWQVKHFCRENDLLFVISSSGNSQNLVSAVKTAKLLGVTTISLTGMNGGAIKPISDYNINIESSNYGVIEDVHMSILHQICQTRVSL